MNRNTIDIKANRRAQKWTKRELVGRAVWVILSVPFALIPRPFWGVRRALLRLMGAKIAADVHIHPTVRIIIPWNLEIDSHSAIGDRAILYALGKIHIGKNVTISQNAHLCAGSHDFRGPDMALLKPKIVIRDGAWVCADAFIGPGVIVEDMAVIGARAVVFSDVSARTIVAGNPAMLIGER